MIKPARENACGNRSGHFASPSPSPSPLWYIQPVCLKFLGHRPTGLCPKILNRGGGEDGGIPKGGKERGRGDPRG